MQTSEPEGCGPEASPSVMPEASPESPPAPTKSPAFDLFNLVLSYKRLEIYLEPLKDAGDGVRYLLRWQMPLCSLLTCLGLNILFLTLNEGAWYSVGALVISVPALLGYLQEVCRAQLPESELTRRRYHTGSVEEAEEAEPDEEFKDAIEETHLVVLEDDEGAPCPAEDELALQDNGFLSKNEVLRSKVSRLTERLRKRYPTNNFGSCTGCSATFSVLKKRRSCSNCGNSFCSRCCSFKVPKSSMGATAPEAQRETVFVCASCNQTLSK
uniref:Protrudin n=1 Tax=Rousettus aegyptiacus TaxID=9407 RepID=A0A7J8GIQ1_ROUAE|nr:zinc finger FYVE-type containing 27 [Rousettus aegyptiacus]